MTISKQSGQYEQPYLTGEIFAGDTDCSNRKMLFGLRDNDRGAVQLVSMMTDDPNHILISSNKEKSKFYNLYKLNIYNGKLTLLEKSEHTEASIQLDNDDIWRISTSSVTRVRSRTFCNQFTYLD